MFYQQNWDKVTELQLITKLTIVANCEKKSSNNDEESIVSFSRISNDQKKWAFSLVTCKSSDRVAELLLWL